MVNLRDPKGALENYQKSLAIYERLAAMHPTSLRMQSGLAVAHAKIGEMKAGRGDAAEGLEDYRTALALYEAVSKAAPNNAQYRENLAVVLDRAGRVRWATGDKAGARGDFRRSLELTKAVAAADPSNAKAQEDLWLGYIRVGDKTEESDYRGRLANYRNALAVIEPLAAAQPANLQLHEKLGATLLGLGDWLETRGNRREAQRFIARGVAVKKDLADRPNASPGSISDYVGALLTCDRDYPCDAAAAVPYAQRAVELTKAGDPEVLETLATAYFQAGDPARAVETEQQAVALVTDPKARAPLEANLAKFRKALKHE